MATGPKKTEEYSCFECEHVVSKHYACQGDSGCDVYCSAVKDSAGFKRHIGDTTWKTPEWCPYRN